MATRVLKELAVAVATYEDRATGQQKNRYENIGVMMESTNDRGESNTFLMMSRAFNPAGVPFKAGSDKILISMFDPKPRDGDARQDAGQRSYSASNASPDPDQSYRAPAGGRADMDDEVPFAMEWR